VWYKEYTEYKLIRYRKDYKMSFSREQLRNIRVEMQNNLTSLGYVSSGLTFKVGNCSYDDDTATFKVVVTLPNAVAPEVKALEQHLKQLESYDQVILSTSDTKHPTYQLTGYKPRATKLPYIFTDKKTNKEYVCNLKTAKHYFQEKDDDLTLEGQEYQKYLHQERNHKGSGGIPKSFDQWVKDREVA
jgi:hypothetical protein